MDWSKLLLFSSFFTDPSSDLVMTTNHMAPSSSSSSSLSSSFVQILSKHTSFFGVKLWALIVIAVAIVVFLAAFLVVLSLSFRFLRRRRQKPYRITKPTFSLPLTHDSSVDHRHQNPYNRCDNSGILVSGRFSASQSYSYLTGGFGSFNVFTFTEIRSMTDCFADENLIARGDSGIVYRGVFIAAIAVAVKRFSPAAQRCEAEEFMTRAGTIANVRHRNVIRLLGCCVEGAERILVYEYIEKGDLHEWLHGSKGHIRPLSWKKRINIINGVAKGLAYLHEDIEPRITHRDIKPKKILLDYKWNPKLLGVGFAGRSEHELRDVSMCSSDDIQSLKTDVHSFGCLIMELVSGRLPMNQDLPQVYLVDWIKEMVTNHMITNVMDPRLPESPPMKDLKRLILIALRCVDPDVEKRPKMGDMVHMLQPHDLLLSNVTEPFPTDLSWI